MSEHAVAAQENHKVTGCTSCVQPVFVWILKCSGELCSQIKTIAKSVRLNTNHLLYEIYIYKNYFATFIKLYLSNVL